MITDAELLSRAARSFFTRSGQLCPEAMIYELHHLKENLHLLASDHQSVQDLQFTGEFLDTLVDFIRECSKGNKG